MRNNKYSHLKVENVAITSAKLSLRANEPEVKTIWVNTFLCILIQSVFNPPKVSALRLGREEMRFLTLLVDPQVIQWRSVDLGGGEGTARQRHMVRGAENEHPPTDE